MLPFEITKEELDKEQEGKTLKLDLSISADSNYDISYESVEETVKKLITSLLDEKLTDLIDSMYRCESPIERMLAVAMNNILAEYEGVALNRMFVIDNQPEITCGKEKYRVDFLISYVDRKEVNRRFVVECDGREYHNKNKQQLEKDYRKDRMLQMSGFDVIRFSGSEITSSATSCAREIFRYMINVGNGYQGTIEQHEE